MLQPSAEESIGRVNGASAQVGSMGTQASSTTEPIASRLRSNQGTSMEAVSSSAGSAGSQKVGGGVQSKATKAKDSRGAKKGDFQVPVPRPLPAGGSRVPSLPSPYV